MANIKKLYFVSGTDVTEPTDLTFQSSTNHIESYASEAAYVTANGAATEGDIFMDTTADAPKCYSSGAWRKAIVAQDSTDATKTFVVSMSGQTTAKASTLAFTSTVDRTFTFPDLAGTITLTAGAQTLTDKTLTSPVLTTPTIGGGSIDVTAAGNLAIGASVGANTMTLGGATSTVTVAGDLIVSGNTTTLNTATLEVEDLNILINKGGNDASSEGAGLTVKRTTTDGSLKYEAALASKWKIGNASAEVEIATVSGAQVFTNKDINGGTASNTNRITVPTNTKTNLDALTRKEGTIVYATDTDKLYTDDGATLNEVSGSSSGAGGRNYESANFNGTNPVGTVTNGLTATGNRSSGQTTWGADNTSKLTIANNTTTPLRETGDFKITHVATGTAFVETPMFNLDTADLGKAVTISFDLTGNTLSGDFDIVVMRYNSSGTYQETISVAGTASSGSPASAVLPTGTTKFQGFFISSNTQADFYSIRFRRLSAVATTSVQFDSFFAGPQSIITGAILTDPLTYTPSNTQGFGTLTSSNLAWRRVGTNLHLRGKLVTGTVAASEAQLSLPTGLTVASFAGSSAIMVCGKWAQSRGGATTLKQGTVLCTAGDAFVNFSVDDYTTGTSPLTEQNGNAIFGSVETVSFPAEVVIPIAEWSSSNTTLAERAVEVYASNSNNTAGTASDTTSFVSGNKGSLIITSTPAGNSITRRIRFDTPILNTDFFSYEISDDGVRFYPVGAQLTASGLVDAIHYDGTNYIGFGGAQPVSGSTTDIDVYFGKYRTGTNIAWSGAGYWRVRKVSGGASIGYPIGARNIVGDTTGTAVPSGYIGQVISATASNVSLGGTNTSTQIATVSLTPGVWKIMASGTFQLNGATVVDQEQQIGISTTTATAGTIPSKDQAKVSQGLATSSNTYTYPTIGFSVNISATTSYFLNAQAKYSAGTPQFSGYIEAVRIA